MYLVFPVIVIVITLLVSRSEHPKDKPFLLTIVSYLKKKIKYKGENEIPWALSELLTLDLPAT